MSDVFGSMAKTLSKRKTDLSESQYSILIALSQGVSIKDYADSNKLSKQTIEAHLANARRFLDVATTYELIYVCAKKGLI